MADGVRSPTHVQTQATEKHNSYMINPDLSWFSAFIPCHGERARAQVARQKIIVAGKGSIDAHHAAIIPYARSN